VFLTTLSVFDYFNLIYRNADHEAYIPAMMEGKAEDDPDNPFVYDSKGNVRTEKQRRAYYRNHWRRRQMSDHEYLKRRTTEF
jgi:hypothetical protein